MVITEQYYKRISGADTDTAHLIYTDLTCPSPHTPKLIQHHLIIKKTKNPPNTTGSEFYILLHIVHVLFFYNVLL